jgi:hypothetical protein
MGVAVRDCAIVSLRTAVEREEKKSLTAAGINVTDRVFTAEEVRVQV